MGGIRGIPQSTTVSKSQDPAFPSSHQYPDLPSDLNLIPYNQMGKYREHIGAIYGSIWGIEFLDPPRGLGRSAENGRRPGRLVSFISSPLVGFSERPKP